jgi:hypothetical protein
MSRGLFSRDVVIDDVGLRRGGRRVAWNDVDHYGYDWQDWTRPGDIVVVGRTNEVIRIAPLFDQWLVAAERAFVELHRRLRSTPCFAPFELDGDVLVAWSARRVRLDAVRHVELAALGRSVIAVVETEAGEWATVDASQIADLWLWLEVLDDHGVPIGSSLPLHLPPVLAGLASRMSAAARLPTAKVVRHGSS